MERYAFGEITGIGGKGKGTLLVETCYAHIELQTFANKFLFLSFLFIMKINV